MIILSIESLAKQSFRGLGYKVYLFAIGLNIAICIAPSLRAQTAKIVGFGATRCLQFIKDSTEHPTLLRVYLAWAHGYMSGILMSRPPGIDEHLDLIPASLPEQKQLEFLLTFCQNHATDGFPDAVESLYKRLRLE